MRKYRKEKAIMIDLTDRKNIKIIQSEKTTISDSEIEFFREQIDKRSKKTEEFCNYIIEKELKTKQKISDEEFDNTMKNLLKQHKILKSLLEKNDTD